MKMRTSQWVIVLLLAAAAQNANAQAAASQPEAGQQFGQIKQAMAENRAKLQKYQWIESTEVSIKGNTKKDEQNACRYAADGTVQKTPIGPPPPPPKEPPRGLRGRVVEKKVDEMKDYMERLKSLISHYAPPDPEKMQQAFQSGKANVNAAGEVATLTFHDYYKQGDQVTFGFDKAAKRLTSFDINTYLDSPQDVVTLTNQFATLSDNTNYLQQTTITSKSKQIEIRKTNSQYTPIP